MGRRKYSVTRTATLAPWWLHLVIAAISFIAIRYWSTSFKDSGQLVRFAVGAASLYAYLFPATFVLMAALSAYHAWRKGELLDSQTSIDTIRSLSWKDFEFLVSEAYRRKGYAVEERGAGGPDGGVDLVLRKDNLKTFVQCKQWRDERVGVSIVRELFGVMAAEGANRGIIVTSGGYTPDAMDFARGNPLELIDGSRLVRLISDVRRNTGKQLGQSVDMQCPQCGSSMILRTAKHGKNFGNQFWGCSQFPQCRATRPVE